MARKIPEHPNPAPDQSSAGGDFAQMLERVYDELRQIAHLHRLDERKNLTQQTTALVHEAWVRLADSDSTLDLQDERHLKALTSRIIRRLLVDQARQRNALKRSQPQPGEDPRESELIDPGFRVSLLDLDKALDALNRSAPRLATITEMRFFGGFSAEQTADALGVSARTVERDWQKARAYLLQALDPTAGAIQSER